jgi:hypothetical protein
MGSNKEKVAYDLGAEMDQYIKNQLPEGNNVNK